MAEVIVLEIYQVNHDWLMNEPDDVNLGPKNTQYKLGRILNFAIYMYDSFCKQASYKDYNNYNVGVLCTCNWIK